MYKELKNNLSEKKILEEQIKTLKERIELKIQNELGLHATTFDELKIKCPNAEDKFPKAFGKIENLDKRRENAEKEKNIIEKGLKRIYNILNEMKEKEKLIYLEYNLNGYSTVKIGLRYGISDRQVRKIIKKIHNNINSK